MSGSGLIYAAIAILWAAVLIPMWLRNHDAATENRSAERFGQAMRVLSRKEGSAPGSEDAVDSGKVEPNPAANPASNRAPRATQSPPEARRRPSQTSQRVVNRAKPKDRRRAQAARPPLTLAQRRARSLGVLCGLTVVVALVAVGTALPWWSAVPFVVLLGAFVVHLRTQAIQKERRQSLRARNDHQTAQPQSRGASRDRSRAETAAKQSTVQEADATSAPESSSETGVVQGPSRAVVVERKGDGAALDETDQAAGADEADEAWRPNPLPLPTYVTAPKAVRPIKVIDLTTPGAWSSGRLLDDGLAEEDLLAAQVAEEELDALIDQEVAPATADADDPEQRAVGD